MQSQKTMHIPRAPQTRGASPAPKVDPTALTRALREIVVGDRTLAQVSQAKEIAKQAKEIAKLKEVMAP